MTNSRVARYLIAVVGAAVALKVILLALDAVPFNADEAVVALMARHILRGERPWFFYGQAYMGSLDAYLIAGAFRLFEERVSSVRLVQIALFVAFLMSGYFVAFRFTADRRTALLVVLLLAFPPVLLTLYTTATLGGYGEALLAGNLLLWWGHRLGGEDDRRRGLWLAWGLVAGLGEGLALISSDLPSILEYTREYIRLENGDRMRLEGHHDDLGVFLDGGPAGGPQNLLMAHVDAVEVADRQHAPLPHPAAFFHGRQYFHRSKLFIGFLDLHAQSSPAAGHNRTRRFVRIGKSVSCDCRDATAF